MNYPVYPKLERMDVTTNLYLAKEEDEFGGHICFGGIALALSDEDPPREYVFSFIRALALSVAQGEFKCPQKSLEALAGNLGKQAFTWSQYLTALVGLGVNTEKLHAQAVEEREKYRHDRGNSKKKAAEFFELLKNKLFVTDNEVREHIDESSIYDLLELVLEHSDATKARINAFKRHAESHAMKADVFAWLDTNMVNYKSMDAAAQAITREQPIVFRTARGWVGEWKKLRSASRL